MFYDELLQILKAEKILCKEPMKNHTTFRAGGAADYFIYVGTTSELRDVLNCCRKYGKEYIISGNGSNLLVADDGYHGAVIRLAGEFLTISFEEKVYEGTAMVEAGAGVMLSTLTVKCGRKGFTGLEFAAGIPGTLGGAVTMNAGAYDGEIKQVICKAEVMDSEGNVQILSKRALKLRYRGSIIQDEKLIVLRAWFSMKIAPKLQIYSTMKIYAMRRKEKQPLEYPSAGSTFKRPEGNYAGALIQQCGLKGYCIGGAAVSEKHAGFVINKSNASAKDIYDVIQHVINTVKENTGVELEPEVKLVGKFE